MSQYATIINGVKYLICFDKSGKKYYDPPLPKSEVERGRRNMKDMIESRQTPMSRTNDDFHRGRGTLLDQMEGDENWTRHLVAQARKRGYNPGPNDVYLGQFADGTGDPAAFIPPTEGLDEVKRRVKASGKGMEAPFVSIEGDKTERSRKKINPRTANKFMRQYRQSGEHKHMNDNQLRKHIADTHGSR